MWLDSCEQKTRRDLWSGPAPSTSEMRPDARIVSCGGRHPLFQHLGTRTSIELLACMCMAAKPTLVPTEYKGRFGTITLDKGAMFVCRARSHTGSRNVTVRFQHGASFLLDTACNCRIRLSCLDRLFSNFQRRTSNISLEYLPLQRTSRMRKCR